MAASHATIRLYGSFTSPYVRRVRIVAAELGYSYELLETASPEGQARLRERTPIWKVPAAEIDGQLVFDSHTITELLLHAPTTHICRRSPQTTSLAVTSSAWPMVRSTP